MKKMKTTQITDQRIINRETIKRIITYCGQRVQIRIQLNNDGVTWDRYCLPVNGDKSKAILWNFGLEDHEVQNWLNKSRNYG